MPGNVIISTTALSSDYCFTTPQQYLLDIAPLLYGTFGFSGTGVNYGSATPAAENEDKPWFKLDSDGNPIRWYSHSSGLWLARHPMPTGSVILYAGTLASIPTFDEGDAVPDPPNATNGPMWERVTELDARSPVGPGTTADGTVIAVGDTLGDDKHAITIPEMPAHHHELIGFKGYPLNGGDQGAGLKEVIGEAEFSTLTEDTGGTTEISMFHPVYGIWFLRRTARLYYRG